MANPNPIADNLTNRAKGRPKGSQNKLGKAVKEIIAEAAESLGGGSRLVEWVQADPKNEAAFWTSIYPKLLPLTLAGDKDAPITVARIELVAANADRKD